METNALMTPSTALPFPFPRAARSHRSSNARARGAAAGLDGTSLLFQWRKVLVRSCLAVVLIVGLLFAALIGIILVPTHFPATAPVTSASPRVKHFYLALGDSLAFGFQPNFNWDQGYAMQWWSELQRHGSKSFVDYGCNGETSYEFIHGGCPYAKVRHNYFTKPQLQAAVDFIHDHKGQVSPVSLDIGADDMIPVVHTGNGPNTCRVDDSAWNDALAKLDTRLTQTILPQLLQALTVNGARTGDLVMMNYYDPFANVCPKAHSYVIEFNQHLAKDAAQFGVPLVNVYQAFGGNVVPNPKICDYTWMCTVLRSIHPNTTGYGVIAHAFEQKMGY